MLTEKFKIPDISPDKFQKVKELVNAIENLDPSDANELLEELSSMVYGGVEYSDVADYYSYTDLDTFVRMLLLRGFYRKTDFCSDDLRELIVLIRNSDASEEVIDYWINVVGDNVSDPEILNYIFYSAMSENEIVEVVEKYKPIAL